MRDRRQAATDSSSEHHDFGHTVGSNLRVVGAAYVVASLSAFGAVIVIARYLGKAEFGRYTVALALVSLVAVVADLGMSTYVAREGAQTPERLKELGDRALAFRCITATVGMGVAVSVAALFDYDHRTLLAVVLLMVGVALKSISGVYYVILQAMEKLGQVSLVQIRIALIVAAAMSLTAALGGGVVAVTLASSAALILSPLWAYRLVRKELGSLRPKAAGLFELTLLVAPFAAAGILTTGLTYVDSLMVHAFDGNDQTGLYGAAYRLPLGLEMFPAMYYTAALRSTAHVAAGDLPALNRMYSRSMLHVTVVAVPLVVIGVVKARAILDLMYGSGYEVATTTFALLMASVVFTFGAWIMVLTGYALREETAWAKIVGVALAGNIAANAAAIPLWGIVGAAAVNLGTMAGVVVISGVRLARKGVLLDLARVYGKPLIAGAAMTGIVLLIRHWPLGAVMAIGTGVYVTVLFALRTFDASDWAVARALVTGQGGAQPIPTIGATGIAE